MKSGEGSVQSHKLSIAPYCAIKLLCSSFSPAPPPTDRPTRFFMAFLLLLLLGIAISSSADSPTCETESRAGAISHLLY